MKHDVALKVAEAFAGHIGSVCERVEIAGSIRRGKQDVKDIEILAVPDLTPVGRAPLQFGMPIPRLYKTHLDKMLDEMFQAGDIVREKDGERYKKIYLKYAGINVDLFLVMPPATWGVQMVIRTGPADFSHWIVTRKARGGCLPNGFRVQDGAVWRGETEIKNPEVETRMGFETELQFLQFLGLNWLEPGERIARWAK
jgi:DNA polymerase/3'-5' exonuclease PolX